MLPVSMYYLFLIVPSVFSNVYLFCMSSFCVVYLMLSVSMYYLFLIVTSVFYNIYLFCMSSFCVVYLMLPVSMYYLFLIVTSFSIMFICFVCHRSVWCT